MKYIATKFGAFGVGLIGGLMITFFFLSVTFAASEHISGNVGQSIGGLVTDGRQAAQSGTRLAGPPALALRFNTPQTGPLDNNTYLPIVIKGQ
jgi:hypothetical protein